MSSSPPEALPILRWPAKYIGEVGASTEAETSRQMVNLLWRAHWDTMELAEHGLDLDTRFVPTETDHE